MRKLNKSDFAFDTSERESAMELRRLATSSSDKEGEESKSGRSTSPSVSSPSASSTTSAHAQSPPLAPALGDYDELMALAALAALAA